MCLFNKLQALLLLAVLSTSIYAADSTKVEPNDVDPASNKGAVIASGTTGFIGPSGNSFSTSINGSCPSNQNPKAIISVIETDEPGNRDISCNMRHIETSHNLNTKIFVFKL